MVVEVVHTSNNPVEISLYLVNLLLDGDYIIDIYRFFHDLVVLCQLVLVGCFLGDKIDILLGNILPLRGYGLYGAKCFYPGERVFKLCRRDRTITVPEAGYCRRFACSSTTGSPIFLLQGF